MKKIICMLLTFVLALSCFAVLTACGDDEVEVGPTVYEIVKTSEPTKIVTLVSFTDAKGVDLGARYVTEIEGENSIFEYEYKRYRTPEEGVADNSDEPVKTLAGKVYYKDHLYLTSEGDEWEAASANGVTATFDLKEEYLTSPALSEDGSTLTATLTAENAAKVFGTDLKANGEIALTVTVVGTSLTGVTVSYTTASGATVVIRTSYSYDTITLTFPEA